MAPGKPQPPRPASSSQLPKVVVEESASPPKGEPLYRGEASPRVQGDASASARAVGDGVSRDDPEAVRRQQDAERDALIGRLLAQVSDMTEQLNQVQKTVPSLVPPAPAREQEPTPTAWKTALLKLVVSMAAAAGAAATLFQIVSATLEPKIKKLEDDKGTERLSDYYTELQRYEYDLKVKNASECWWRHTAGAFQMVLPAPDRMGAARKPEPFVGDEVCPDWPTLPDKPKQPSPPPKKD